MTLLEILLILVGIAVIIISCFLLDKPGVNRKQQETGITDEELTQVKNKLESAVADLSEETVNQAEDALSKLSNEKIIAVDEFSNQVIEKINQNHDEVLFLYNMLNEKETSLNDSIRLADRKMKEIREHEQKSHGNNKIDRISMETTQSEPVIQTQNPDKADNHNSMILELHKQGKSVMEISKMLGLGQGEVKLVIGLFLK